MVEQGAVGGFVALVLAGGLMAAWMRHILYAIIGLGISLFGLAGLFLTLGSPFVAAMQILIYIGGITVAIIFAMMLSIAMTVNPLKRNRGKVWFAGICAVGFFGGVAWILKRTEFEVTGPAPAQSWELTQIGYALLNRYNLVFETLSVVLLIAIIGAILIAKERPPQERAPQ